jgi:hypothetical protein
MPELSCILTLEDVDWMSESREDTNWRLVSDGHYQRPVHTLISAKELLARAPYPHGAYMYNSDDLPSITMSRIAKLTAPNEFFYSIDDLHLPEHLRFSVFLKDESHAGFLNLSHHARFLGDGHNIRSSERLQGKFRTLRRRLTAALRKCAAGRQSYFVSASAIDGLSKGTKATTYGSAFDKVIIESLPPPRTR